MLLSSNLYGVLESNLTLAAMLSVPLIFIRPKDKIKEADLAKSSLTNLEGDHLTLINVYNSYIEHAKYGDSDLLR